MSTLSPELLYFSSRMSGFSTNTFKLETNNQSSAVAGQIVSVDLPSNSIVNLRTFSMFFNAVVSGTAGGEKGRLPPVKDLIERVEVSMGGIVLSQGTNFTNVLCEAKKALYKDYGSSVLGHPEYIRAKSYNTGGFFDGDNENDDATLFCVNEWEGFIGTADPMLFDTSLVPNIKVRLYMAANSVLSVSKSTTLGKQNNGFADASGTATTDLVGPPPPATAVGSPAAIYTLTNIHFTIECINLADMTYENLLAAQIQQQGELEVPYKAYYTFTDTHQDSSKFSVAASSMDRVWLAWRGANYAVRSPPVTVPGYKIQGGFVADASAGSPTVDVGVPQYDIGGVLGTNEEKYKGRYFTFSQPVAHSSPNTRWTCQLQLNGAYMPQFPAQAEELYQISKHSVEAGRPLKEQTLNQYKLANCVQCFRLNMPNSEFSRTLSGIDTRATNLSGIISTTLSATPEGNRPNLSIFVECSEVLNIAPGRSISVTV